MGGALVPSFSPPLFSDGAYLRERVNEEEEKGERAEVMGDALPVAVHVLARVLDREAGDDAGEEEVPGELRDGRDLQNGVVVVDLGVAGAGAEHLGRVVDGDAEEGAAAGRGQEEVVREVGEGEHAERAERNHIGHCDCGVRLGGFHDGRGGGDRRDTAHSRSRGEKRAELLRQPRLLGGPGDVEEARGHGRHHDRDADQAGGEQVEEGELHADAHDPSAQQGGGGELEPGRRRRGHEGGREDVGVLEGEAGQD
jgi:hypothetical protein